MKWFYEWRLRKVRAEISALEESTHVKLLDDYTGHSRLRVLNRIANSLEKKLAKYSSVQASKPAGKTGSDMPEAPLPVPHQETQQAVAAK